jgi:hypothetical protein
MLEERITIREKSFFQNLFDFTYDNSKRHKENLYLIPNCKTERGSHSAFSQ